MAKPTELIIDLTGSFIKRRYKINWIRIALSALSVAAAIFIIYEVITSLKFLNDINNTVFVAFISLAGLLLGTVAFGLIQPTLTTSEKINDAKEINKKMISESNKPFTQGYTEFFKCFNDVLEKFYK